MQTPTAPLWPGSGQLGTLWWARRLISFASHRCCSPHSWVGWHWLCGIAEADGMVSSCRAFLQGVRFPSYIRCHLYAVYVNVNGCICPVIVLVLYDHTVPPSFKVSISMCLRCFFITSIFQNFPKVFQLQISCSCSDNFIATNMIEVTTTGNVIALIIGMTDLSKKSHGVMGNVKWKSRVWRKEESYLTPKGDCAKASSNSKLEIVD